MNRNAFLNVPVMRKSYHIITLVFSVLAVLFARSHSKKKKLQVLQGFACEKPSPAKAVQIFISECNDEICILQPKHNYTIKVDLKPPELRELVLKISIMVPNDSKIDRDYCPPNFRIVQFDPEQKEKTDHFKFQIFIPDKYPIFRGALRVYVTDGERVYYCFLMPLFINN